jgi:hypothetical protein
MNRSPSVLSARLFGYKIEPRGEKTNRHDRRHGTLAKIMPPKGKACVDDPKYRKAKPDGSGAHLEENSTTQARSALALRPAL